MGDFERAIADDDPTRDASAQAGHTSARVRPGTPTHRELSLSSTAAVPKSLSPERRRLRAEAAGRTRWGRTAEAEEARQQLKAAAAEDYITNLIESAPVLTAEQRDRLALLLRGAA